MAQQAWSPRQWDPAEWQSHCEQLLQMRYGVDVQLIPDRVNGDGGLEAYVARDQTAFQCYAVQDPLTVAAQTNAQKSKITADTSKLIDHPDRTVALIGPSNRIARWVLLTPTFDDKEVVAHAHRRSATVRARAAAMGWCDEGFQITVHTDGLFAAELALLSSLRPSVLSLSAAPIDPDKLSGIVELPTYEQTLNNKLVSDPVLAANRPQLERYATQTLQDYVRGQVEMARLSRQAPAVHQRITECGHIVFEGLSAALVESDARPATVVSGIRQDLFAMLKSGLPDLPNDLALLLARYFIASWWLECPLVFEPGAVAAS